MMMLGIYPQKSETSPNDVIVIGAVVIIIILAMAVLSLSPVSIAHRALAFVLLSAAAVIWVIWWNPYLLVTFDGHGKWIGYGVWLLLGGLVFTHASLMGIMWVQRKTFGWVQAFMLCWTGEKSIYWGASAYFFRPTDYGAPLINLVVFSLLFITTLSLDIAMFLSYILGWDAERDPPPKMRVERRSGKERRQGWSNE